VTSPLINLTLPVFNEETRLAGNAGRLRAFLDGHFRFPHEVVIANNGSTDRTREVAESLRPGWPELRVVHLPEKGRGRALRRVWAESEADVLSYMDIDLSTDLAAFPRLIEALVQGPCDLATGSRLLPQSETTRCWNRELISRAYNRLVSVVFRTRFSDAQCGFKAITRKTAAGLLSLVEDNGWFFDTELLVWAERRGHRILELPVRWTEDADSRVRIVRTAGQDLRGMLRLRRNLYRDRAKNRGSATPTGAR
jgi:glycosyltransferase involved in cell wall biosynthesis